MRGRLRRGVRADVAEQVVEHAAQARAVAEHRRGLHLEVERPRRVERARRLDRLGGELAELDRLVLERLALVEAREQQQVLDELLHAVALAA